MRLSDIDYRVISSILRHGFLSAPGCQYAECRSVFPYPVIDLYGQYVITGKPGVYPDR